MSQRRATSVDVAHAAGVSRATVSYVLNDTDTQTISAATRARVTAAAERLDYRPFAAARTLRSGRSEVVIGLVPDRPMGPSAGTFLQALSRTLAEEGLTLLMHPAAPADGALRQLWTAIAPAAVLVFGQDQRAGLEGIDIVVNLLPDGQERRAAAGNEAYAQVEHLVGLGHRCLAFARPDDDRLRTFAGLRLDGVRRACRDHRLPAPSVRRVSLEARGALAAIRAWTGATGATGATGVDRPVTAVCAYNDEVALAVLAGMHALGLRAPDDLAVIGVDDIPTAALAVPALSTVSLDIVGAAADCAHLIAHRIAGGAGPAPTLTAVPRVVRRDST